MFADQEEGEDEEGEHPYSRRYKIWGQEGVSLHPLAAYL